MPLFNLLEDSDNYVEIPKTLWKYHRDVTNVIPILGKNDTKFPCRR